MHPRTELKNELVDLLRDVIPGVPVYASRSRQLRPAEHEAIIIYIPSELIALPPGRGEARTNRVLSRTMTIDILVVVSKPGDGEQSSDRADEIARTISLKLNAEAQGLIPSGEQQEYSTGEDARVITTMSFTTTHTDKMES